MNPEQLTPEFEHIPQENVDDVYAFDFDAWESELEGIDLEEQARQAFDGLLTFETEDEHTGRTIEDIKDDIVTFMSNPEIVQMQQMVDYAAEQFAQFCNHNHIGGDANSEFSNLLSAGNNVLGSDDGHDHGHESIEKSEADDDDDEYEIDPKTGKRVKKRTSLLSFMLK